VIAESKLFSGAATRFGGAPNAQVSLVDAAMPGMLPVINDHVVDQAIRTGLALGAEINPVSVFDRKNYFYPDLPQGYQISQYGRPIVGRGAVSVDLAGGGVRSVGITRLHLEQDAGKSIHDRHPTKTYIDLNRSGVPLMEIVSEPDLRSGEEAALYVAKLRAILRTIGTCDGNMEQGSLRADANVSVRRPGAPFGTRSEIKNMNSVRFLRRAIDYEAARQIAVLEDGGEIKQETRLFDPASGETRPMRSKEEAHDYRYFPDPDLLPLRLSSERIERARETLPELPDARKRRFVSEFGLKPADASVLVAEAERADYFEAVAEGRDPKLAANWVLREVVGALNRSGGELADFPISPDRLGALIDLEAGGTVSARSAKQVFEIMLATDQDAGVIVAEQGLGQVTDTAAIEAEIDAVLAANPDQVAAYKAGAEKLLGFFVGQVMRATQGKANPQAVNEILRRKLAD
jgi:aspartyl-tRNA(Asn)/glutamyl-tRNA(Gln) amidotransferase subunit B